MNSKLQKMQAYIDKMEAEYGEDWTECLPIYYHEQRKVLEECGYSTDGISDDRVWTMFQNIVMDLAAGLDKNRIELKGMTSTCSVMDWIEEHGCPDLDFTHFEFPDDKILGGFFKGLPRSIVVSRQKPDEFTLELHPVESWHQVTPTQKRIYFEPYGWDACIQGEFYWMTI